MVGVMVFGTGGPRVECLWEECHGRRFPLNGKRSHSDLQPAARALSRPSTDFFCVLLHLPPASCRCSARILSHRANNNILLSSSSLTCSPSPSHTLSRYPIWPMVFWCQTQSACCCYTCRDSVWCHWWRRVFCATHIKWGEGCFISNPIPNSLFPLCECAI